MPQTMEDPVEFALSALANYGADITCGACMEVAFTGVTTNVHTCKCVPVTAAGVMVSHPHCPVHGTPKLTFSVEGRKP
jgi:hypothetical protein